ncbi:hypothetical protein M153_6500028547 [Pseudoloma neurophilia]|uniref:Uncharacterized protein n=1 Tax=Pseudoloma neurophilia TaxID=146866 RepID=A0A0R0M7G1_9MICR|nr:hypothetical protein M153_6500028547 [Pseudoloma neurophilia]
MKRHIYYTFCVSILRCFYCVVHLIFNLGCFYCVGCVFILI